MDETSFAACSTDRTSRKSPTKISAPSDFRRSERSSIWRTNARTRAPRSSSIPETCRPVLPWVPPAAEVTRTVFVITTILYHHSLCWYHLVPCDSIYGTDRYQVKRKNDADESKDEAARAGSRSDCGPEADCRRGPFGVHGGRLCADQHAGDCDARARFETRALCVIRQQGSDAGRMHHRARPAAESTGRSTRTARQGNPGQSAYRFWNKASDGNHRSRRRRRVPAGNIRNSARTKGCASAGIDRS